MVAGGRAGPYLRKVTFPTTESQNAENIKSDLMEVADEVEESTDKPVCYFFVCFLLFFFVCIHLFICLFVWLQK